MSLFSVGFVIFPQLTQLDFTGPLQVLSRLPQSKMHIIAKSEVPVPSDCGLSLVPTHTFATSPDLDLVCVPGGFGVREVMDDEETVAFVRRQARGAKYVTSVCTGAFVLGAAGLLGDVAPRLTGRTPISSLWLAPRMSRPAWSRTATSSPPAA